LTVRSRAGEEGGAERFFAGLHRGFVDAGFAADLVAIPSDESTFEAIEETYLRCYDFDASAFDAVVSTKAPTYLVRHPNHVCYLVHTIRVFYDMFDSAFEGRGRRVQAQRRLVQRLDTLALSRPRTRSVFTIGHEVARRLDRHNGIEATVLHPPVGLDALHAGPFGDYVLLPGRLHRWKRVQLAIAAMRHVARPLRLLIAGSGEDADALRASAAADERIVFLGRVPDDELVELYANALAIAFVPLREDYGYVTVEAFRSGKPVVTCTDSGEAALLVEHERTGLVVAPDARSIASAFERLHDDRGLAHALGAAAHARERTIRWDRVVPILSSALGARSIA
ncbi:MAG TPA: glycosyltransferase, partial [Casimicrobiaceae bacterium]|nr:glycosyltransferase [Casimicrobiaceae bacterium]